MDKELDFIKEFVASEFITNVSRYSENIEDEAYQKQAKETERYFHSILLKRYPRTGLEFANSAKKEIAKLKIEKQLTRTIFQIKEFEQFQLGDRLQEIVDKETNIFTVDTSYTQKSKAPLSYSNKYYLASTNEGLKIIYEKIYILREEQWIPGHDHIPTTVLNDGIVVNVQKVTSPLYEPNVKDYLEN